MNEPSPMAAGVAGPPPPAPTPTPSQPSPGQIAAAAAAAVCNDPVVADLLRRKAGGEKLSPQENGKLGAWKSRQGRAPASAAIPEQAPPSAGGVAPASGAPPEAEVGAVVYSPADADLVRGTVKAMLGKINAVGQRHLLAAAKAAGADAASLARFSSAEVVSAEDAQVLSETALLVASGIGVDPKNVPMAAFFGTLAACGLNFYQAIAELKELQATAARSVEVKKT